MVGHECMIPYEVLNSVVDLWITSIYIPYRFSILYIIGRSIRDNKKIMVKKLIECDLCGDEKDVWETDLDKKTMYLVTCPDCQNKDDKD